VLVQQQPAPTGRGVVFDFRLSRSRDGPRQFLASVDGILQTDAHAAYQGAGDPKVVEAACPDRSGPASG
jgi:hypothetical protein